MESEATYEHYQKLFKTYNSISTRKIYYELFKKAPTEKKTAVLLVVVYAAAFGIITVLINRSLGPFWTLPVSTILVFTLMSIKGKALNKIYSSEYDKLYQDDWETSFECSTRSKIILKSYELERTIANLTQEGVVIDFDKFILMSDSIIASWSDGNNITKALMTIVWTIGGFMGGLAFENKIAEADKVIYLTFVIIFAGLCLGATGLLGDIKTKKQRHVEFKSALLWLQRRHLAPTPA